MQQGQIIERGKHEDLIAQKGVYSELVQLQQMNAVK
jgi:ABC-type multidrug transport system fused ATPase/permease subunit